MVNYLHHSHNPRGEKEIKGDCHPLSGTGGACLACPPVWLLSGEKQLQGLQILWCTPDSSITYCLTLPALWRGRRRAHTCLTMGRKKMKTFLFSPSTLRCLSAYDSFLPISMCYFAPPLASGSAEGAQCTLSGGAQKGIMK